MQTVLNPYLNFKSETREAMEFYKTVFGGKLDFNTFKDFHASVDPSEDNLIMHSVLEAENGIKFMAADIPKHIEAEYKPGTNISLSLSGDNEAELRGYFEKLSVGGRVVMPLEKAPWGDTFGEVADKFGIKWLVNISPVK